MPVTKRELKTEMGKMTGKMEKMMEKIDARFIKIEVQMVELETTLRSEMYTKADHAKYMAYVEQQFANLENRIQAEMYTKADHANYMEYLDRAMSELLDSRDDRKVYAGQLDRLDNKVDDHEKRIRALERN